MYDSYNFTVHILFFFFSFYRPPLVVFVDSKMGAGLLTLAINKVLVKLRYVYCDPPFKASQSVSQSVHVIKQKICFEGNPLESLKIIQNNFLNFISVFLNNL